MKPNHLTGYMPTIAMAMYATQQTDADRPVLRVKELSERDRRRLLMHFLALGEDDRLLRFGNILSDEVITRYVQRLDFSRDSVFGVFDADLSLIGVGHIAFVPREAMPSLGGMTRKKRIAEFGVSVSASARRRGIGSKLFGRAAIHCRNEDVDTLYMHCLSSNTTMMRIAKRAGMRIQRDHGQAEAYLKLAPADPATMLKEAIDEQYATLDYTFRLHTKAAFQWGHRLPHFRKK